jgi:hypothetical protein
MEKAGHLKKELFSPISVRKFKSTKFTRRDENGREYHPDNLAVEESPGWDEIEEAAKAGRPTCSKDTFEDVLNVLHKGGGLDIDGKADSIEAAMFNLEISRWKGNVSNQDMITLAVKGEKAEGGEMAEIKVSFLGEEETMTVTEAEPTEDPTEEPAEGEAEGEKESEKDDEAALKAATEDSPFD